MTSLAKKFKTSSGQILLLGLVIILGVFLFRNSPPPTDPEEGEVPTSNHEIEEILQTKVLDEQVELYIALMDRIGPEAAQDALFQSGVPFDGQSHLLNHSAGDYIYQKFGPSGLSKCRLHFLASCPHGFVIDAVGNGGINEVTKIVEECKELGSTTFVQCSHAIGHGLLADIGYAQLDSALALCDEVGDLSEGFPLFNCYDGVFMENIWAIHEDGRPSPDRWIDESDLFYPCNDERVDPKYHLGCWSNQPALIYQNLKGDLKKTGEICATVEETRNRDMCFNGLARQIHPLSGGSADEVFKLCGLLPESEVKECITTIVNAEYSVGGRELPFVLCERHFEDQKDDCFGRLLSLIRLYNDADRPTLCRRISDQSWQQQCLSQFN